MDKQSLSKRHSGIELLKILSVMMICGVHYLGNGILWDSTFGSFNSILARMIESCIIICVNIFVLIAGYFGVTGKGINVRRIVDMLIMVAVFNGGFYIAYAICGKYPFDIVEFLKSLIPYMFEGYWFIRVYLILTLLSPFLSFLLKSLNKKAYLALVIISLIVFSILPSFNETFKNNDGYDIIHFTVMYIIGGYIRLHLSKIPNIFLCFLGYFFCAGVTFIVSVYGDNMPYFAYDFIPIVFESCFLFMAFMQMKFKSAFINHIAKSSLAIFVLENSIGHIYDNIMNVKDYMDSPYFLLHFVCCVVGFTAFALTVDCLRRFIFKYTVDKLLDKIKFINTRVLCNIDKGKESNASAQNM